MATKILLALSTLVIWGLLTGASAIDILVMTLIQMVLSTILFTGVYHIYRSEKIELEKNNPIIKEHIIKADSKIFYLNTYELGTKLGEEFIDDIKIQLMTINKLAGNIIEPIYISFRSNSGEILEANDRFFLGFFDVIDESALKRSDIKLSKKMSKEMINIFEEIKNNII